VNVCPGLVATGVVVVAAGVVVVVAGISSTGFTPLRASLMFTAVSNRAETQATMLDTGPNAGHHHCF